MVLALLLAVSVLAWEVELEVEWRPSYCLTQHCSKEWKINDFAITSFHPAEYTDCLCGNEYSDPDKENIGLIKHFFPHKSDSNGHKTLWKSQWEHFGCCMSLFPTSTSYLLKAVSLLMDIHPMEKLIIAGVTPGKYARIERIEGAFGKMVNVACAGAVISTVTLYLDGDLQLTDGPIRARSCPGEVSVPVQSGSPSLEL